MASTQKQIEKLTKDYTAAITALIREEVVEETKERMVKFFMNGEVPKVVRKKSPKSKAEKPMKPNGKEKVGAKRSPKALERLQDRLLKVIQDNPGIYSGELSPKLKVEGSRVLSLPLKKLRESNKIRKTGNRRETRYYPQTKARKK